MEPPPPPPDFGDLAEQLASVGEVAPPPPPPPDSPTDGAPSGDADADAATDKGEDEDDDEADEDEDEPMHSPYPPTNPFKWNPGVRMDAVRLVAQLESFFLTQTSIRRATNFSLQRGDVVLVSGPCAGEIAVARALRRLVASDPAARLPRAGSVPWMESSYLDKTPDALAAPQPGSLNRLFRSTMTVGAANPARNRASATYIVLLRHPADLRAAWFAYLRRCWEDNFPTHARFFDENFKLDDFVKVDVSVCSPELSQVRHTYETFASEWYRESTSRGGTENVLVVFYEALLIAPERELRRIHEFLRQRDPARTRRPEMEENRLRLAMRDLGISASSAAGRGTDGRRTSFAARLARRLRKGRQSATHRADVWSAPLEDSFVGLGEATLRMRSSVARLTGEWSSAFSFTVTNRAGVNARLGSYDELYEHVMDGETYPFPQVQTDDRVSYNDELREKEGAAASGGGGGGGESGVGAGSSSGNNNGTRESVARSYAYSRFAPSTEYSSAVSVLSVDSNTVQRAVKAGSKLASQASHATVTATVSAVDALKSLRESWRRRPAPSGSSASSSSPPTTPGLAMSPIGMSGTKSVVVGMSSAAGGPPQPTSTSLAPEPVLHDALETVQKRFFSNSMIPSSMDQWDASVAANPAFGAGARPTFESVDLTAMFEAQQQQGEGRVDLDSVAEGDGEVGFPPNDENERRLPATSVVELGVPASEASVDEALARASALAAAPPRSPILSASSSSTVAAAARAKLIETAVVNEELSEML